MKKTERPRGKGSMEGILGGIGEILTRLGELAEKGEELKRTGEVQWKVGEKDLKGVYGFSIKTGLMGEGIKVEPFGNIRKDDKSGCPVVQEFREPVVDVFEEEEHILIVAEMPGIGIEDVRLEVKDDLLTISAQKEEKKYRKELLLPRNCPREKMRMTGNNGILEIRCEW
jgi:HSP20 family protein